MTKSFSNSENRLAFIDQLRGIAVLGVIVVHAASLIPTLSEDVHNLAYFGAVGVQLFFIVSAYTLCLSFEHRAQERRPVLAFYIRRLFRIAPAYYLALAYYFSMRPDYAAAAYTWGNLLSNVFFVHGLVPSATNSIIAGGWSVGTEMLFYALFPLLFQLFRRVEHSLAGLALLVFISVAFNVIVQSVLYTTLAMTVKVSYYPYVFLPNQLPVFCLGMVAYFLHKNRLLTRVTDSRLAAVLGMSLFLSAALVGVWFRDDAFVPIATPLVAGIGFFFMLNRFRNAASSALLRAVGRCSYSIYLSHFAIIFLLVPYLFTLKPEGPAAVLLLLLTILALTLASYGVAWVMTRLIERNGIRLGAWIIQTYLQRTPCSPPKPGSYSNGQSPEYSPASLS